MSKKIEKLDEKQSLQNSGQKGCETVKTGRFPQITLSLMELSYPYEKGSMLRSTKLYGFEYLMFCCALYCTIIYPSINFLQKQVFFKTKILWMIYQNLLYDAYVFSTLLIGSLFQMYVVYLLEQVLIKASNRNLLLAYNLIIGVSFVGIGLYAMNEINFYFTDRIFITVVSWVFAVKNVSYNLALKEKHCPPRHHHQFRFLFKAKYLISPEVVYSQFLTNHNPQLQIHIIYLLIKAFVASIFLFTNYIVMTEFLEPLLLQQNSEKMYFFQLFFKLIPIAFYVNFSMYYLIVENIFTACAELAQLNDRRYYQDWWNAETVSQFLDKWVLQINAFSLKYLNWMAKSVLHCCHVTIIFFMLFCVFGKDFNYKMILFWLLNITVIYFFAENQRIQNNYIVHILTISFTPFLVAAQQKFDLFS